jgi:nicotinamidase-related amidase
MTKSRYHLPEQFINRSHPFLTYLAEWHTALPELPLSALTAHEPERTACISVDVINGFCKAGPLASERVGQIAQPIADLFTRAHAAGVRNFALTQDTHDPNTPEFNAYPPHCVRGTEESETVDELKALPFFDDITIFRKNSLSSSIGTELDAWLMNNAPHAPLDRIVVVGDCTDLCVYHTAMHLRLYANAHNVQRRVVVPADGIDTFDIPVPVAYEQHINAHDGDLHHVMFLHHMAMNGVEVVQRLSDTE